MTEAAAAALPAAWSRLHPLSPVVKGGKALTAVVAVTIPQQLGRGRTDRVELVTDVGVALVLVLGGVVSWLVTRWRVHAGELQLETGVLRRQSVRVPLTRVQAIDVVRPLAARVFGISELRLVLAGSGSNKARLTYLPEDEALRVRELLLSLGEAPRPEGTVSFVQPIAAVPNGRLVASVLLGGSTISAALLVVALVAVAALVPHQLLPELLPAAAASAFAGVSGIWRRVNAEFSFSVGESPDGLSLHSGLLQTRAETIPAGRVQGVRLVEPVLWRPLGWCRLEVDVAQQREHEQGEQNVQKLTTALLPVGSRTEADALVQRILPGATTAPPPGSASPARARRKAPLSYHFLASWYDDLFVAARTGRLQARTTIVPRAKVQSVRWTQGPVQRLLDLATVHIDTAGRHWHATARDRDAAEGQQLLWLLTTDASAPSWGQADLLFATTPV